MNSGTTRWAALFPGQGSQAVGMGKDLFDTWAEAREVFERADEALGTPLSKLCFEGPEEDLALTANTQPALLTVSVAAWRVLEARVPAPQVGAGHSLGEFSALVAAGALTFEDAVRAVRCRGEAMQLAVPVGVGGMAAVIGLPADKVDALCRDVCGPDETLVCANLNGPDQTVVAGHATAVERLVQSAPDAGAKRAIALNVSAPFHSPLMQPAADRLAEFLADIAIADAAFPVIANVTAAPETAAVEIRDNLIAQVCSPVRWVETMQKIDALELSFGAEVGPGRVLAGLARRGSKLRVLGGGAVEPLEKLIQTIGHP